MVVASPRNDEFETMGAAPASPGLPHEVIDPSPGLFLAEDILTENRP